ncbi:hypothetical protein NTE_00511 [Candidatus Nitrososphaera evergladensis SR1]|uniref:Uncharacterized protein n=1 Tax=Candidatus Nitrososphaera evergladensis SR1 TaxID=1459636 RepID=A0A075MP71_9ARCH|nr:hypothetical protein NTE_00511 [Candidatus Nitrososphaera evergladensis SR1]
MSVTFEAHRIQLCEKKYNLFFIFLAEEMVKREKVRTGY